MVLTAVDLTRVVGVVVLGPVLDLVLVPVRGQVSVRVLGLDLVPTMVPITGRGLDRPAARLPLLLLRRAAIRLSRMRLLYPCLGFTQPISWKRRPPPCHPDRSEPGFPATLHWKQLRV